MSTTDEIIPPSETQLSLDVDDVPVADPRDAAPPPDAPKPKTPEELAAENERLQVQVGHLTAERDTALLGLRRPVEVPIHPTSQPPPQDDTAARAQYEAFLESIGQKQLTGDYKGAAADIFGFVNNLVEQKTKQAQVPIAGATARQAVRNFESQMRTDDLFPVVQDRFKGLVETALPGLSTLPPDQLDTAIEGIYNVAVGQEARLRRQNGRREQPPPYGEGSPSSGARPAARQKPLSAMQRQYIISAREAGIPEDRQRAVLDQMEREQL